MKPLVKNYVSQGFGCLVHESADAAWLTNVRRIRHNGNEVAPRGKKTLELMGHSIGFDMKRPVIVNKSRKLNYKFMAAEAHWILSGDDRVSTIAPFNRHIEAFSDDGERFYGAYGPRVVQQFDFVVSKLKADPSSRQATLTTWRPNPPETKDVPCTVAMNFAIRDNRLMTNVFMRSNDVWLGTPYDVFSFTMISCAVAARLNAYRQQAGVVDIEPGALILHAASSHLYEVNFEAARQLEVHHTSYCQQSMPSFMWLDSRSIMETLEALKESKSGDAVRWWEQEEGTV